MREAYISVIVPVYNAEQYLEKCIRSIIEQTYSNLEIILVDDGSTDESGILCDEFADRDMRIRVIHQKNGGQNAARRTGVKMATGEYVTFVDADDYIDLNAYEGLIQRMETNNTDIVAFGMQEEYLGHTVHKKNHYPNQTYNYGEMKRILFPTMLSNGFFFDFGILPNLVCKLVKRSLWENSCIEADESITFGEDADLTFQLLVNAQSVQVIDYAPYHYVRRNDSMMWKGIKEGSIEKLENDLLRAFQRAGVKDILKGHLDDFITFVSLLKQPKRIADVENTLAGKKIALYGAGGFGQAIYAAYGKQVTVWVDGNYQKYSQMGGCVCPVECLLEQQEAYDMVFVAILNVEVCQNIKESLVLKGIEKPIWYYTRQK